MLVAKMKLKKHWRIGRTTLQMFNTVFLRQRIPSLTRSIVPRGNCYGELLEMDQSINYNMSRGCGPQEAHS
ncbi:unnamed protein product [Schistosoma mattheei]|uniref:Uncharacterized protein n=1 Tax=Schistosoma mattheei TaxID=31246 RepID=A0A183P1M6_9TREM|nr:unnamed protein product [Schistosoma mattheei]